jgi:hypothetical protein
MSKVRLFLDVDGVLNACTWSPDPDQWNDWEHGNAQNYDICYSPTVGKFFTELTQDPRVEILWLTTWEGDANVYISPMLGMPRFPVAGYRPFREKHSGWWKYDIVREWWAKDPIPFVWIDDDLDDGYDCGAGEWARSEGNLTIKPRTAKGLTAEHLIQIQEYIDNF